MSISNPEFSNSTLLKPVDLHDDHDSHKKGLGTMMLAAIGVVFGDIGTSPLYALKECFDPEHGIAFSPEALFGVISMMIWALILVVTVKYVLFVMRADNKGEGGILALTALVMPKRGPVAAKAGLLVALGIFGTALLYGDGIITPAISVLSAVEGLEEVSPAFSSWVIPIAIVILLGLFMVQKRGTGGIGKFFGPITLVWFAAIACLGVYHIASNPSILWAISPYYAVKFIWEQPTTTFLILGAVVLCVTGGEALYADMGHFGKVPIQLAWNVFVLPSLALNYMGQGAFVLSLDGAGAAQVIKSPQADLMGDGTGILIVDDLVDSGKTLEVVRKLYPNAHFATVYAKPSGKPMVDSYITEVSQDTWIFFPWDMALQYVQPFRGQD